VPSLLWQTLRLTSRHFLPLFAIGGLPWAIVALITILLGQEQTLNDLKRTQVPLTWDLLYPFLEAYLYALLFFPQVNGAPVQATAQALQAQPVRVIVAYRAVPPCWGRLPAVYWGYGAVLMAIGLVLTLLARWHNPSLWQGSRGLALAVAGDLSTCYLLILMTLFTQILVLEGTSLRQTWTRIRQLNAGAGWRLVGLLIVVTVAGMPVLEVGVAKAGQRAEVLGSGLKNLLCVVGVTGVYWEEQGREKGEEENALGAGEKGPEISVGGDQFER
jgi:hypothetical protein